MEQYILIGYTIISFIIFFVYFVLEGAGIIEVTKSYTNYDTLYMVALFWPFVLPLGIVLIFSFAIYVVIHYLIKFPRYLGKCIATNRKK